MRKLALMAATIVISFVYHFDASAQILAAATSCSTFSIGEHNLYACVYGSGPATAVLEAGMREDSLTWRLVVDDLSKFSTVIAYDRAGMGHSDAGAAPRTSVKIAQELKALLARFKCAITSCGDFSAAAWNNSLARSSPSSSFWVLNISVNPSLIKSTVSPGFKLNTFS